jgi:hypothetical protein
MVYNWSLWYCTFEKLYLCIIGDKVMPFNINGFLGLEINEVAKKNYTEYKEYFSICEELNRFAISLAENIQIRNQDSRSILSVCLFLKIHNAFQSSIILYKYGLNSEAKIITRASVESLIFLKANLIDHDFCERIIASENKEREFLFSQMIKHKDVYKTIHEGYSNLVDDYNELVSQNKKQQNKKIKLSKLVEETGLYYEYYYIYNALCKEIHINLTHLQNQYLIVENGETLEFDRTPRTNDIIALLMTNCHLLISSIDFIKEHVNISINAKIQYFKEKITV